MRYPNTHLERQTWNLADMRVETDSVEALTLEKSGPRLFVNMAGLNGVGVFDYPDRGHLTAGARKS